MKFIVETWTDQVKEKTDTEAVSFVSGYIEGKAPPKYRHVFDTRELAHAFIRERAEAAVAQAMANYKAAVARAKKCHRKFA